jgi:predicted phosphodiesterase
MRYGVVGDVHGNLHALETALAALDAMSAEVLLCPGDLVGYGPRPNQCVAMLADRGAVAVAGNHDLMAIDRLPRDALPRLQRETIEWTREALDPSTRDYLTGLPLDARTDDGLVLTHGGLGDPELYVRDGVEARAQLAKLGERDPDARALLAGHTHHPMACSARLELPPEGEVRLPPAAGPWFLNAGSVGQPREPDPVVRVLVIDLDEGRLTFLALRYDDAATRRELRAAGLPEHACHLAPGRRARWRRRFRSALR